MRRWREVEQLAFDKFISPDELHMNDWSYACVARALGTAIADAATRPAAAERPARSRARCLSIQPLSFSSAITRVNSSTWRTAPAAVDLGDPSGEAASMAAARFDHRRSVRHRP